MAKGGYIGVSSTAHRIKKIYIGQDGVAKKVKKAYIGDANSKAQLFYATGGKILISAQTKNALMFDTSDKALTTFTFNFTTARMTACQYANGKWITAYDAPMSQSSFGKAYLVIKDENTLVETSVDLGYGQVMGLAVDSTNIYVFQWQSNNTGTYFKIINQSTLTVTSSTSIGGIYIGQQTYPVNPWNMCSIISSDKFLVTQYASNTSTVVYLYNKTNNTLTQIASAGAGCVVHNRAISGSKAGFRTNNGLYITDGSNITGPSSIYQTFTSMHNMMAYGNGRWVATTSRYAIVSTDDGATWTQYDQYVSGTTYYYLYAITFADGVFYATALNNSSSPYLCSSVDGITWITETALTGWTSSNVVPKSDLCFSALHGVGNA